MPRLMLLPNRFSGGPNRTHYNECVRDAQEEGRGKHLRVYKTGKGVIKCQRKDKELRNTWFA